MKTMQVITQYGNCRSACLGIFSDNSLTAASISKSNSKVCSHTQPHTHVNDISLFYWTSQVTYEAAPCLNFKKFVL